jgi:hypothetical protein
VIHKPDGTSTNTNAEMGFPRAMDEGLPAFVTLPVLFPVPPGKALPTSKSIADGIPPPPEGKNWWPPLLFWMECIRYLFERNNGRPVTSTAPNSLFAGGEIILEDPDNWNDCCMKESIHSNFQVLLREHDLFLLAWPTMSAKQDQKLLGWYNKTKLTAEELASTTGSATPANNASNPIDLTVTKEILSQLGNVTMSSKDKSNDDLIKSSTISWQLVGSCLAPKDDCPDMIVIVPGSINPAFEAVIKETNKRIRGMKMAESFHYHVEQQRKEGKLAAMASKWTKEQLDVPFANAVAKFAVLNDSIVSESSSFGYKITIFCFLVVLSTKFHFKKRVSGEQFANRQDLHGESDRNKAQKTTELFVMGEQKTIDDVVSALYNMMNFLTFINTNGDKSSLFEFLFQLVILLTHTTSQSWFHRQTASSMHVPHNVLVIIQDAIAGCFAFASSEANISMLNNNEAIPPLMLEEARIHAEEVVKDIKVAISKSSNPFSEPSLVWQYFSPADSPQKPSAVSTPRNRNGNGHEPSPKKKQRTVDELDQDRANHLKNQGFLQCSDRRIPPLNVSFPMPTGDTARLCIGHCFVNRFCKEEAMGVPCRFAHPNGLKSMADGPKAKLIEAVSKNSKLDLSPAEDPPPPQVRRLRNPFTFTMLAYSKSIL